MKAIIETLINHGHVNADGRKSRHHCPGMWVIEYDERGVIATCNECKRVRNLTEFLDVEPVEKD